MTISTLVSHALIWRIIKFIRTHTLTKWWLINILATNQDLMRCKVGCQQLLIIVNYSLLVLLLYYQLNLPSEDSFEERKICLGLYKGLNPHKLRKLVRNSKKEY